LEIEAGGKERKERKEREAGQPALWAIRLMALEKLIE